MAPRDRGRFFVGELLPEVEDEDLTHHFRKFGHVTQATVARNTETLLSLRYGFVSFYDAGIVDKVVGIEHHIFERSVRVQRDADKSVSLQDDSGPPSASRASEAVETRDKDPSWFFVGRLPDEAGEQEIKDYFGKFGEVEKVQLLKDQEGRSRKCAFVKMPDAAMAGCVTSHQEPHEITGHTVTVKPCIKEEDKSRRPGNKDQRVGGGLGSYGGGHHPYGHVDGAPLPGPPPGAPPGALSGAPPPPAGAPPPPAGGPPSVGAPPFSARAPPPPAGAPPPRAGTPLGSPPPPPPGYGRLHGGCGGGGAYVGGGDGDRPAPAPSRYGSRHRSDPYGRSS